MLAAALIHGVDAVHPGYGYLSEQSMFAEMEMNTRIQVEHPLTETVYGVYLIKEKIRIASGDALGYKQEDSVPYGHAIEQ